MSRRHVLAWLCVVATLAALFGVIWWLNRDDAPLLVLNTVEEYANTVLCPEDQEPLYGDPETRVVSRAYLEQVVENLEGIKPPPELREFHKHWTDTFRLDIVLTPAAIERAAYNALDPETRERLDAVCFPPPTN